MDVNHPKSGLPHLPHTGVYVSLWASLRLGNHKMWGVAGGLGALGIRF